MYQLVYEYCKYVLKRSPQERQHRSTRISIQARPEPHLPSTRLPLRLLVLLPACPHEPARLTERTHPAPSLAPP